MGCQAAHNALYEAAVEIMENPPGVGTQRDLLDHRLGTMGHLLQREGYEAIMRERDEARGEAEALVEAYAELLRAHTRAIWALEGECDYPLRERSAMGKAAGRVLADYRAQHPQIKERA